MTQHTSKGSVILNGTEASVGEATGDTKGEQINVSEELEIDKQEAVLTIETGDSIKVKQVLDDSTIACITEKCGYEANYTSDNWKLGLMFTACCFALTAQFYPVPFPKSIPLLGVCCATYFILSGIVQCIITFIDKDRILTTKESKTYVNGDLGSQKEALDIRTSFPRYQEWFTLIVHKHGDKGAGSDTNPERAVAEMYVGKYFTTSGDFDENRYHQDVRAHIKRFEGGKYGVFKYDHKSD